MGTSNSSLFIKMRNLLIAVLAFGHSRVFCLTHDRDIDLDGGPGMEVPLSGDALVQSSLCFGPLGLSHDISNCY